MAKENGKSFAMKETTHNNIYSKPSDMNEVEMIFGSPNSPKTGRRDVHTITNERNHGKETHGKHNGQDNHNDVETFPTQPLLEPDRGRQKPPLAGPEVDDLDEDRPATGAPYPGIDDGLLEPGDLKPDGHKDHDDDGHEHKQGEDGHDIDIDEKGHGTDDGNWWPRGVDETDFHDGPPFSLDPRFGDDRPGSPFPPGSIPDVNTYQQKKNLAQGMMDLALLSANANQLRYVLESSSTHPYYYFSLAFISLSIIFQVAVGVGLIMNSRYNVKDDKDICKADKINNMTVLGIFLVTIVNVFITSFSVASPNTNLVPRTAVQTVG